MPRVPSKQVPKHPLPPPKFLNTPLSLSLFFLLDSMPRPERELQCPEASPEPCITLSKAYGQKLPLSSLKGCLSALGKGRWEGGSFGERNKGDRKTDMERDGT